MTYMDKYPLRVALFFPYLEFRREGVGKQRSSFRLGENNTTCYLKTHFPRPLGLTDASTPLHISTACLLKLKIRRRG